MAKVFSRPDFLRRGDLIIVDDLLDPRILARLAQEAFDRYVLAEDSVVTEPDKEEIRGGQPPRRFLSAAGGPVQHSIYHAPATQVALRQLCGVSVAPTGPQGTFNYYVREGDHLALHRDIQDCDLAVITAIHDAGRSGPLSGSLCIYPARTREPLSAVRANPEHGAEYLRLRTGQTLVMSGGVLPHALLPISGHHARIVSILCFRAV